MKHTVFFILAILTLSLGACSGKTENKNEVKKQVVHKRKAKVKKPVKALNMRTYLTDVNIVDFLTDYAKKHKENKVIISTRFGDIKIRLYDDTPLHRANFIYLVRNNFYNDSEFTRVVKDFMIQTGRTDNEEVYQRRRKFGSYTIPAEIRKNHFHKKGAIAMGRNYDNNPDKRSSSYEFYIVQGKPLTNWEMNAIENSNMIKIPEWRRKVYRIKGGTPHLDGEHTVFGEVYEGFNVIDSIASVEVDKGDWPIDAEKFNIKVIK